MTKKQEIQLDCGVYASRYTYQDSEILEISLIDLYNGFGPLSKLPLLHKLFKELDEKGFSSNGISRHEGYYNSTDDLILDVTRKI